MGGWGQGRLYTTGRSDVIHYRTFRNDDPPGLVRVWNESLTGRGAAPLPCPSVMEEFVFAKPYFDRAGLVVAVEGGTAVGYAHGGFGPDERGAALSTAAGVVCLVAVRPSHRRRGIGSELLRRCEAYLTGRGANTLYAGPASPLNPFYLGLYGGSESPGVLASDADAAPFLARHGYAAGDTRLVLHRDLGAPFNVTDGRFLAIRRRYDLVAGPRRERGSWWQECTLGPIELLEVRLAEKGGGPVVARASAWEMIGYSHRWRAPAVGVIDLHVREDLRRQGLARFLVSALLRHVQDQFFHVVEAQTPQANEAAVNLYRGLGFEQVDAGHVYRKT